VHLYSAVIVAEGELSEFVHEETYARARSADHLGKRLLADFRNYRLGLPFLAEVGQQQKQAAQPLFARIEELIDKVCFKRECCGPKDARRIFPRMSFPDA
jgi:hypothetical protein